MLSYNMLRVNTQHIMLTDGHFNCLHPIPMLQHLNETKCCLFRDCDRCGSVDLIVVAMATDVAVIAGLNV